MKTDDHIPGVELNDPDQALVEDAYRGLPQFGELVVIIPAGRLTDAVRMLEDTGFCGIQVVQFKATQGALCKIRGYKGKAGPCFDTGCTATYTGAARAALDDDHHLMILDGEMPVCAKTARIYSLPPYRGTVNIKQPPSNQHEPRDEPKPFDCDDFEKNLELLDGLMAGITPEQNRIPLFYPGPFRKLILSDGTIVHRGSVNMIPKSQSARLIKKDLLFAAEPQLTASTEYFQATYQASGAHGLFVTHDVEPEAFYSDIPDLRSLSSLQSPLKKKLKATIRNEKRFFILTGSDPQDTLGCCPSDDVAEANRLVRAGVLSAYRQPGPKDACPLTTYGFNGEFDQVDGQLQMTYNHTLRKQVLNIIENHPSTIKQGVVKWSLLFFVLITAALAVARLIVAPPEQETPSLYALLNPEMKDGIMIVLFHNEKRCVQCLNMERFITDFVNKNSTNVATGQVITFKLINMNEKRYAGLVNQFGIFTSTPVLIDFRQGRVSNTQVLHDAWKLHLSPDAFKDMLENEMAAFTSDNHE